MDEFAFPHVNFAGQRITGMTLRDYFAGQALQGLCARTDGKGFDFASFPKDPMRVALWAYDIADAMLEARKNEVP
jgi:hypothetical protein